MKLHNCKVGTIPSRIQLKHNYKIREGIFIVYRFENEHNWKVGQITEVHDSGYFFVRRIDDL